MAAARPLSGSPHAGVSGSRFVQSGFDRRPTDQVHVLRQVLHDASASVKTVAGDHEHPLGKPRRDLREQFHSQFRTRFVSRRRGCHLPFSGGLLRPPFLLTFGQSLLINIQPKPDRQSEGDRRCPRQPADDDADHHPVVPPTEQLQSSTGEQRIVMHARSKQPESPFAAKCVVHGERDDRLPGHKRVNYELRRHPADFIKRPLIAAEESMKVAPGPSVSGSRRDNQIGDEPMPMRKHPPGHQCRPQRKAR